MSGRTGSDDGLPVRPSDVRDASSRLRRVAHRTPLMTSRLLDGFAGGRVFLKCESFQRGGSFKFRGAYNAISRLEPERLRRGVVAHSSGNHGQGVAIAARLMDAKAVVVMPDTASPAKRQATISYGARVVPCAAVDRERVADELVEREGLTLVHPYDDERIIAGQGTSAWEMFEDCGAFEVLVVPVGGGGLISGCAVAASELSPGCRVIGVEPEAADDGGRSWREGRVHSLPDAPSTVADGLRTRHVGERNLAIMRRLVHDMIVVSDAEILEAVEFLRSRMKLVVEPSGAVPVAALLSGRVRAPGQRIALVISGGNG